MDCWTELCFSKGTPDTGPCALCPSQLGYVGLGAEPKAVNTSEPADCPRKGLFSVESSKPGAFKQLIL